MSNAKFKISLRENGEHSFKKSLESYSEYDKTRDQMLLKDTILFLHNGIELLMKEMLVRTNEFLIFEDLKDIPRKQKEARKHGIGIFFIENPPRSVTYEEAYKRVDAFINPPELDESLLEYLRQLNLIRNQLEHYAIEVDTEKVIQVLEALHEPILKLFEKHLGPFTQLQTPQIDQTWRSITSTHAKFNQKNHEVSELMRKFNGQRVPGSLFGVDGEVVLPKFDNIYENHKVPLRGGQVLPLYEVDIYAESAESSINGNKARWAVEIKLTSGIVPTSAVHQLKYFAELIESVPWLVVFGKISTTGRFEARDLNVMLTDLGAFEKLKRLVMSDNE